MRAPLDPDVKYRQEARYDIAAFNLVVTDVAGKVVKTISLPAQSGNLASGQALSYTFTI